MTGIIDIKRAVTDNRVVRFVHYHNSELWYVTEFDEAFPVPISDLGSATAVSEEKALLFMRYMRKWNTRLEEQNG